MKRFLIVAGDGYHHEANFDDGQLGISIVDETFFRGREDSCKEILALRLGQSALTPHPLPGVFESIMRIPDQEEVTA